MRNEGLYIIFLISLINISPNQYTLEFLLDFQQYQH